MPSSSPSSSQPMLYTKPDEAATATLSSALDHLKKPLPQTFLAGVFGGLAMALSGTVALLLATGIGEMVKEQVPILPRFLQGTFFPLGLVIVSLTGSAIFTSYPMWMTVSLLTHRTNPHDHPPLTSSRILAHFSGPAACWLGNLTGSLFAVYVLSILTGTFTSDPHAKGIAEMVASELVEPAWGTVFVRAVGCGWAVSLGIYLGEVSRDTFGRAFGLWLPFALSTMCKWPHTVEYQFLGLLGLFPNLQPDGYTLSTFIVKAMLPITLGNAVGGGLIMGGYVWFAFLWKEEKRLYLREDGDEEDE